MTIYCMTQTMQGLSYPNMWKWVNYDCISNRKVYNKCINPNWGKFSFPFPWEASEHALRTDFFQKSSVVQGVKPTRF